jgi:hypothetical protein
MDGYDKKIRILERINILKGIVEPFRHQIANLDQFVHSHSLVRIDQYVDKKKRNKYIDDEFHVSYEFGFVLWDGTSNFAKIGDKFYISSIYFDNKITDFNEFSNKLFRELSEVKHIGKIKVSTSIYDVNSEIYEEHVFKIIPLF